MRTTRGGAVPGKGPVLAGLTVALALAACSGPARDQGPQTASPSPVTTTKAANPVLGGTYTRQDVLDMYEKDGGALRLSLPVTLPEGYSFVGFLPPDVRETASGERVVARKAWFDLGQETLTICVESVPVASGVCPDTNIGVSRTRNGVLWSVSTEVPVSYDTALWGQARYSANPADWTWLEE
ncbi:hypothetical protein KIH74_04970 [Kineosporia sp. J2-2]|uniref:Lipoprotein n=1 Tax=Kineosporia corallincola TaxID=2835133 RepID=A0ABS5TB10_9ACTN|nr:hypothetical protein [Kineosporia corallincola]MBT0768262.1 hypothetical protein [Kineosporia corallincola]